jgi:PAS domain S-box-containing protein
MQLRFSARAGRQWRRYSLAVVCVVAATLARFALAPVAGAKAPWITYWVAVIGAGYAWGSGPALAAALVSLLVGRYLFVTPVHSFSMPDGYGVVTTAAFFVFSLIIGSLAGALRASLQKAETARQRARAADVRAKKILDGISDAFLILDREWRCIHVNDRAVQLSRRRREQLLGHILWDVVPRLADRPIGAALRRAMEHNTTEHFEQHSETGGLWLEGDVYPSSEGVTLFLRDVTERKRAEEEQRLSEQRFRVALKNTSIVVFNQDRDLRYTWLYTAMPTPRAVLGKTDLELDPGELGERLTAIKRRALETASSASEEIAFPVGDTIRVYHLTIEPLRDTAGAVTGITGAALDITERKQAEADLAGRARELQTKSEELERSNAELEQYAYAAAHDLQEPLRTVTSYAQLLGAKYGEAFDADGREYLGYIQGGAQRMARLIRDLLSYSRVVAKAESRYGPVDTDTAVAVAVMNCSPAIRETGAKIDVSAMPKVTGNLDQLVQLFQNLITNAIKYRGEDPPQISIRAARGEEAWTFSVEDNGIGLDMRYATRIFGVFKRLHGPEIPGTGIGLAVCKKIVEQHGGRIWVESEVGRGSKFHFSLPGAGENAAGA